MSSIGQNLQPFTGNDDVSKGVKKILGWDEQTNKQTPTVFLPLFAGEFHKRRKFNAQYVAIYNRENSYPKINYLSSICNQILFGNNCLCLF